MSQINERADIDDAWRRDERKDEGPKRPEGWHPHHPSLRCVIFIDEMSTIADLSESLVLDSQLTTTTMDRDYGDNNVDDNNAHISPGVILLILPSMSR